MCEWENLIGDSHLVKDALYDQELSGSLARGNCSLGAADPLSLFRSGTFDLINIPSLTMWP